ncbi:flagellar assembly protein A [Clostridium thermobutyricum]|uniref:flagellar assembly protein A n=1 Tax=Clostridium thermobutyricum TaxID=29372 RepID=UPI003F524857
MNSKNICIENKAFESKEIITIDISKYNLDSLILKCKDNITVLINEKKVVGNIRVNKEDKIICILNNETPKRNLELKVRNNNLEVLGKITYKDSIKYKLCERLNNGFLEVFLKEDKIIKANRYTLEEVLFILNKSGIKIGIQNENIQKLLDKNDMKLSGIFALGVNSINDNEDIVKPLFFKENKIVNDRIDYRNKNNINMVRKGECIGKIIRGELGKDGQDVYGEIIHRKIKKTPKIICKNGCYINGDEIIATIDGKFDYKKNTFNVSKVLEINKDINMESGNIQFIGNLCINGSVGVGMTVASGDTMIIKGNAESAKVVSKKDAFIDGSVIQSTVLVGVKDENLLEYIENLKALKNKISVLKEYSEQLINNNRNFISKEYGSILRVIIDKKLLDFNKVLFKVLSYKNKNESILDLIRKKFMGVGILTIKNKKELDKIICLLENEINNREESIKEKWNLTIGYAQDAKIDCSGDIIFTGKGEYISEIRAGGDVKFLLENSVLRGGSITAEGSIICKTVGSSGGATTILKAGEKGKIIGDIVYRNTIIKFGNKSIVIDEDSKNLKAFMNNGEIEIEKLNL